jgi:hypothetical protein
MRHGSLGICLTIAVVTAACGEGTQPAGTSPVAPSNLSQEAKPGTPPTIPLRITVSNTDASGNPSGITNDGLGDYVDGVQNVEARLDSAGTLAFNTFTANHGAATRWVNYDFSRPVDPLNLLRPPQDHTQNYHFSTGPSQFSPFVPVQYLGTPGYPTSQCGYMGNSFQADSSRAYRVSFHKGYEDTADSPSSFAVFTRVSVTPAVWTVQPAGSCSPSSNIAALRSADGTVFHGYYSMPFFFRLTAK